MKNTRLYFKAYPEIVMMFFLMSVTCIFTLSLNSISIVGYTIGALIVLVIPGLDPYIKVYEDRIEVKHWGILFFRGKTIVFKDIESTRLQFKSSRGTNYVFSVYTTSKKHTLVIKDRQKALILLHILKMHSLKVSTPKGDTAVKDLYKLMEKQRESEGFKLEDLPQHDKKALTIQVIINIATILFLGYMIYKFI